MLTSFSSETVLPKNDTHLHSSPLVPVGIITLFHLEQIRKSCDIVIAPQVLQKEDVRVIGWDNKSYDFNMADRCSFPFSWMLNISFFFGDHSLAWLNQVVIIVSMATKIPITLNKVLITLETAVHFLFPNISFF